MRWPRELVANRVISTAEEKLGSSGERVAGAHPPRGHSCLLPPEMTQEIRQLFLHSLPLSCRILFFAFYSPQGCYARGKQTWSFLCLERHLCLVLCGDKPSSLPQKPRRTKKPSETKSGGTCALLTPSHPQNGLPHIPQEDTWGRWPPGTWTAPHMASHTENPPEKIYFQRSQWPL